VIQTIATSTMPISQSPEAETLRGQNGKAILPVTSLTPGIYNIRIQQNQKVEYAKFIKN
jgi:hypothetical protein